MAVKQNPPQDFVIIHSHLHTHAFPGSYNIYHLTTMHGRFYFSFILLTMPETYITHISFYTKKIITPYQFCCKKYKFVMEQNKIVHYGFRVYMGPEYS